jgi:hypothetical protein
MDNIFITDIRDPEPPIIYPWKVINMNPDFGGQWLVGGDLDGDGEIEFVATRNHDQIVTALGAYKLDGTLMWTWGEAGAGDTILVYDVPVQIFDIDGDGNNEVLLSEEGYLVILDGRSGKEIVQYPLPEGLNVADCITFANKSDIIIKTRYTKLWTYTNDWKELWNWTPDKYYTCHHPTPVDIDGDGKDEILAGYTMLDHDGKEIWTFKSNKVDLSKGHLDCCRVAEIGDKQEDFRFVITCCAAGLIAMIDGSGNVIWEIEGHHFESPDVAPISPNHKSKQIYVDIDHHTYGDFMGWLIDFNGELLGKFMMNYSRHHRLVDWNGDGFYEIVLANALTICDGIGKRVASFDLDGKGEDVRTEQKAGDPGPLVSVLDVSGNGAGDVVLHTDDRIFVYKNPSEPKQKVIFSDSKNFTLY